MGVHAVNRVAEAKQLVAESRVLAWILSEVLGVCDAAKMLVHLVRPMVSRILSRCSASPHPSRV